MMLTTVAIATPALMNSKESGTMTLTLFEDRAHLLPLIHFLSKDDGSVTIMLREPMNQLHLLPNEIALVKAFLENL